MSLLRLLRTPDKRDSRRSTQGPGASTGDRTAEAQLDAIDHNDVTAIVREAKEHAAARRFGRALVLLDNALATKLDDPLLLAAKGATLFEWGRQHEALEVLVRAAKCDATQPGLALKLGRACLAVGQANEALHWLRRASHEAPGSAEARFAFAVALQWTGQYREAIEAFDQVLACDSTHYDARSRLGECALAAGDAAGAEKLFRALIATRPDSAAAWSNLGAALMVQRRFNECISALERAVALEEATGEDVDAFINLGVAYTDDGQLYKAISIFQRHLPNRPSPRAGVSYSGALLRAGYMDEGWRQYEFRRLQEPAQFQRLSGALPDWNGQSLKGRTILLNPEQGVGDCVLFIRYAAELKKRGARVIVRTRSDLVDLLRSAPGIDAVLTMEEAFPAADFQIPVASLPRILAATAGALPAGMPYLQADGRRAQRFGERLDALRGLKVGLAWAGNPAHAADSLRSMTLDTLAALFEVPGIALVSLQKGFGSEQAEAAVSSGRPLHHWTSELRDLADMAALIAELDVVITIDTSIGHVAGALGKPVWLMLSRPSDLRWRVDTESTSWYPMTRLVQQTRRGDWSGVVERIVSMLHEAVRSGIAAPKTCDELASPLGTTHAVAALPSSPTRVADARPGLLHVLSKDDPVSAAIIEYGEYRQREIDALCARLRPGDTAICVAPGIGLHLVAIAETVGPSGHVIAYESRPVYRRILVQNLSSRGITNVTVMRRNLGPPTADDPCEFDTVDTLNLQRLALLKIDDIESAADVIAGADQTLWRTRPKLSFAANTEADIELIGSLVSRFGYRSWRIDIPCFDPANFARRSDDVFGNGVEGGVIALPEEYAAELHGDGFTEIAAYVGR